MSLKFRSPLVSFLLVIVFTWLAVATPACAVPPVKLTATTLSITAAGGTVTTVNAGTVVTLTATVTAAGGVPVSPGQVLFCDATATSCNDIHRLGLAQLTSAGSASYKFIPGPGTHTYKAAFLGTPLNDTSVSTALPLAVAAVTSPIATTVGIQASGSVGDYALLGTVATNGTALATGSISFLDTTNANYILGSATLGPTGSNGISFLNSYNFLTPRSYSNNIIAGSVAVADFNGDGVPDIVVTDTSVETLSFLQGNGDGTFRSSTVPGPAGYDLGPVVTGDFNGDGKTDLAVSLSKEAVAIYLGNGDGTFTAGEIITSPITDGSGADIVTGDFNRDGIADLAQQVCDSIPGGESCYVRILLGNGDGTFTPMAARAPTNNSFHMISAVLRGEAIPDLVISSFTDKSLTVLLGNGDGTFTPAPTISLGIAFVSMAAADLNGDGHTDLVVTNESQVPVTVLLGKGDGTFTQLPPDPNLNQPTDAVELADFNGDGIPDLILPNPDGGNTNVFLGKGDGTFVPDVFSPSTAYFDVWSIAVADFNGDGQSDIAEDIFDINDPDPNDDHVSILLAQAPSTAAAYVYNISPVGSGLHYIVASYPGDANNPPGLSAPIPLEAQQVTTTLTLGANPTGGSPSGQTVTLTASLSPNTAQDHDASGSVTFTSAGKSLGTASVVNGVATLTVSTLATGTDNILARYPGDTNFTASTSAVLPYSVSASSSPTALIEPVGATSPVQTVTLTFTAAGTLSNIAVLTLGTPNLDFQSAPGSTCATGTTYAAGQTCTVNFTFTPTVPGLRLGGITLTDAASDVLTEANLSGIGTGPQVIFTPAQQVPLTTNLVKPYGLAYRPNGDLFVADSTSGEVKLLSASSGYQTYTVVGSGFTDPVGLALDGNGNLFVTDYDSGAVIEVLSAGNYATTRTIATLGQPVACAVDGAGNLFVGDNLGSTVKEFLAANNYATVVALPGSYPDPLGIALDSSGDLFVAGTNHIQELTASSGYTTVSTLPGPFPSLFGIATDANANLYVTDRVAAGVTASVEEVLATGGYTTIVPLSAITNAYGLALDGAGNIFVSSYSQHSITRLTYSLPPTLTFASTTIGTTSSDSPQTVTLTNNGNAPLNFTGVNPFITRGFDLAIASTCPELNLPSATASLAPDASCTYAVNFSPVAPGPLYGQLIPTDNNLNVINAQQIIPLNGVGSPLIPTVTTASEAPNPSLYGQPVVFTAHVAPAPGNTGTPTGDVLFTFCHGTQVRRTLDAGGNVTFTTPIVATFSDPAATCPYTAGYLGDSTFAPSTSASTDYTVLPAASTTTLTAGPNPGYIGQAIILTATVKGIPSPTIEPNGHILPPGAQTPTGPVQFYADGSLLGSATITNGIATLSITTLSGGTHALTAVYPGDADLTGSASASIPETIILPDFTLTATPPTITIATGHRASMSLTLTSLSGFTGPVTITCGQLPAYATCYSFTVNLAANATTTGTLVLDTNGVPNFYGSLASPAARLALATLFPLTLLTFGFTSKRRRNLHRLLSLTLLAIIATTLTSCAGHYPNTTTPGVYTLPLTATGTSANTTQPITHTLNITLNVTQ